MAEAETSGEARLIAGRYELRQEIGAGGMGVVYDALDHRLSRPVALKLIHPHRDAADDAIARLEREALSAAKLGHPNIVRVLDFGQADDGAFLVMEQLTGETLEERVSRVGRLDPARAVKIHLQLLDALASAHDQGVVHRDIKPSNVFLTALADGSELVKLLDFGLAYLLEEAAAKKLTATGIAIGTPAYMSPERVRGAPVDARCDLYAVGVSLYECLTGQLPFAAATPVALRGMILLEQAPSIRERRPGIAAELVALVERAMEKDPADRFATAQEMAEALRAAARGLSEPSSGEAISTDAEPQRPAEGVQTGVAGGVHTGSARDRRVVESSETMPAIAREELGSRATMAALPGGTQRGLGKLGDAPEPAPPPARRFPETRAPERPATLPRGGVTRPHAQASAPVEPPVTEPARVPPRRRARGWLLGLAVGMSGGLLVLVGLWVWHLAAAPTTPSAATPDHRQPSPRAPTERAPAEGTPSPAEVAVEVEVEPAPEPAPVGVETPVVERAPVEAPAVRRPRPPRRAPVRRAPAPVVTPPPRPPPASAIDGPLEPDWGSPPPR